MNNSAVGELKQIPFEHLIGGPLTAAIKAQALAAQTTVDFITQVGLKAPEVAPNPAGTTESDAGEVRYVTFKYKKSSINKADGSTGDDETGNPVEADFRLTVPFLTIVPIPYIRIEEMTIDFRTKLDDMVVSKSASALDFTMKASAGGGGGNIFTMYRADFRVSAATKFKSNTSTTATTSRHYEMDIHVRASQDEMPTGLSKILDVLEQAILNKQA